MLKHNLKNRFKRTLKNNRGITMIQMFIVIVILIVLIVTFSDMGLMRKVTGGNKTVAWTNDLTTLVNSVLTNDITEMTYGIDISDGADYKLRVTAPPVSAYDVVDTYDIDDLVELTFDDTSKVTAPSGYTVTTYHGNNKVPTTSYSGSDGIAPFINLGIPQVEESLLMGLMGAGETKFGKYYEDNNDLNTNLNLPSSPSNPTQLNALLAIVFGFESEKDFNTSEPNSWVTLNLMDTLAMKDILKISNRFLDEDAYRLYWVSSVVTENEAINIIRNNYNGTLSATDEEEFRKLYQELSKRVLADTIIVMPNSRNDVVYTESSDFKYYKFTSKD